MTRTTDYKVLVEWGDCDPAGIVFYPYYFRWFDYATDQLFDEAGLPTHELVNRFGVVGKPIAEASSRFLMPSRYRQRFVVRTRVESWQEKRFTVLHQGFRDGQLLFEGREVRFLGARHPAHPDRLRAIPIPAEMRALFEPAES
jgi:4-hydroxybenzoyl-CoA thioesterase